MYSESILDVLFNSDVSINNKMLFFLRINWKIWTNIYIPKYVKSETDNEFVNSQNVSAINIHGYNSYAQIKNSLK